MKKFITAILLHLVFLVPVFSQNALSRARSNNNINNPNTDAKKTSIKSDVRAWRMIDNYTLADTIPVDTLLNGHQINNPIWIQNISNVTLGNLGSPSISTYYPTIKRNDGNIFYNSLLAFIEEPNDFEYYNTKTPYTNFTYQMGFPKRRSEEFVQLIFTQNVNRRLNVGFKYKLSTSIGRYESQRADHVSFRLFSSFDGDYYKFNFSGIYHKATLKENGGIINDNYILYPDSFEYEKAEDIPVQFMDQKNKTSRYQLVYSHSLDIAHTERLDNDSNSYEVPVATVFHKLYIDKSHHEHTISDLGTYDDIIDNLFPAVYNDPHQTADSVRYFLISNMFQLKMSEEFNSLLRFGLRAYICNEVRRYHWPKLSTLTPTEDDEYIINYHQNKENLITTYIGGQIFKNIGDVFKWNAGAKFYIQGYRAGDLNIDGSLSTTFNIFGQKTEIYAKTNFEILSPELFEESYTSNHYSWEQSLNKSKTLNISGGITMPNKKFELKGFMATLNERIYWGEDCIPTQKNGVVQIFGAYIYKHFSGAGFNSINRLTVQHTSDKDVMPLPTFAIYSSNFFEHLFFGVLQLQLGFDFRYNTKYYTPKYNSSLMQFCVQNERKIGNYFYVDPFVNFHIKRIRFYFKYEHLNKGWTTNDYFHTIHYPANPGMVKYGISWNFYD